MRRSLPLAVSITVVIGALGQAAAPHQTGEQSTFHAAADAVVVDVTVLARGRPVTGLSAADFSLLDDDRPQPVHLLSVRQVPLDLSLVVDASGSVKNLDKEWTKVRAAVAALRPGDRVGLTTFGTTIREVAPLQGASAALPASIALLPGTTTLIDALARAFLQPSPPTRRHVIVEMTDGHDFQSVIGADELGRIARRSDATAFLVLTGTMQDGGVVKGLADAVEHADGVVLHADDLGKALTQILASLDAAYVLAYRPVDVPALGWHTIAVHVTRAGSFTVTARHGYFRDAGGR